MQHSPSNHNRSAAFATLREREVADGSEIPTDVIACMERALGGPYTGAPPDYARFPAGFEGDIEPVYRLQAFAAP